MDTRGQVYADVDLSAPRADLERFADAEREHLEARAASRDPHTRQRAEDRMADLSAEIDGLRTTAVKR